VAKDVTGTSDPYVIFTFGSGKTSAKSSVVHFSLHPKWKDQVWRLNVKNRKDILKAEVKDHDLIHKDDPMGHSQFDLSSLRKDKPQQVWLKLELEGASTGEILVELTIKKRKKESKHSEDFEDSE